MDIKINSIACLLIFSILSSAVSAECVWAAKSAYRYRVIDNNTIILTTGVEKDILIRVNSILVPGQRIAILKDAFCDYEQAVLSVEGELVDAAEVRWVAKR